MDSSADFDDANSPRTADHDDIDFDINTPRDNPPLVLSNDFPAPDDHHSEIPSIVITEPSSADLVGLEDDSVTESHTVTNDDKDEAKDISSAEVPDSQAVVDTSSSPSDQNNLNEIDLEFVPDEVIVSTNKELQGSENGREEVTERKSAAIKQDPEIEVNVVADLRNATGNIKTDATSVVLVEQKEIPEKFTDFQVSQSANMEEEVKDEIDETVSLDNIVMKDKTESDSDDEFDFDLPAGPSASSKLAPARTAATDTPSKPPESIVTATPSIPTETKGPFSGSSTQLAGSSNTQKPVPTSSQEHYTGSPTPLAGSSNTQKPVPTSSQEHYTGSPTPLASSSNTQKPVSTSSQEHYAGFPTPQASSSSTQKPVAVIKPTSQAPCIVQPPPDEGTQRVLEAAQAEWDKVTTIQAGYKETDTSVQGAEPTVVETVKPMSPHELVQIFIQEDFSDVRSSIKPAVDRHGFSAFVNFLFGPPKLHRDLIKDRDTVFCVAASQLCNDNSSHIRTLQTIYRCLTGSKFDCPRIGSHWEEIGFQGSDPATDLRGAGLLGLMNLLHLLKDPKKYQLASDIYRLSLHPTQNFPFCVMGINLSRITLQTLREGLLNKECNRRHEVICVVNDFYVGLYLQLYKVWKGQGKTISDSGYIIKDIETRAKKTPGDVFKNLDEYLNKKTLVIKEKSSETGGDNFVNVCDDTN